MRIAVVYPGRLPAVDYGGIERFVVWLGRGLRELGHEVAVLAAPGSHTDFAPVFPYDPAAPVEAQLPGGIDFVHLSLPGDWPRSVPACLTYHETSGERRSHHPNTVFVSAHQARANGGEVFVWHGLDPSNYPEPDLDAARTRLTFLGKAAWRVKNVRGAIAIARRAGLPVDVLGGSRLQFSMGFRLTLDWRARFHGMVDDAAKAKWLNRSRGLVNPVRWHEPFGVAIIEALYFGVPVFGTPYGSLRELVPPFAGHLATSAEELSEAILTRSYEPERIHGWAREQFHYLRMARDYIGIYEKILGGGQLHASPPQAPPTRPKDLLPWTDAR
jgi:glycosyltransferase involved in cell wall biosynthesis